MRFSIVEEVGGLKVGKREGRLAPAPLKKAAFRHQRRQLQAQYKSLEMHMNGNDNKYLVKLHH